MKSLISYQIWEYQIKLLDLYDISKTIAMSIIEIDIAIVICGMLLVVDIIESSFSVFKGAVIFKATFK